MSNSDLAQLIKDESEFFRLIISEAQALTGPQRESYRLETVSERRHRISKELAAQFDSIVQRGPFRGMRLDPNPAWGMTDQAGMLLGVYETEVIEEIFSPKHSSQRTFVDLGAADGYYAIGGCFSMRFDHAHCFETTLAGQETILRNAQINKVESRLSIHGHAGSCFYENLEAINWDETFILCDVEGAEFDIFSDTALKAVRGATVLIEIHNWVEGFWDKYQALLCRASKYFEIDTISRLSMSFPNQLDLRALHDDNRALILSEGRPNLMRYLKLS
jgi:hypothetical protein